MTKSILFINMAKGYGGGEVQTEALISQSHAYTCYFLGKRNSPLAQSLRDKGIAVKILTLMQALRLVFTHKQLIVHAQDGRGAHIAHLFKKLTSCKVIISRHVYKTFNRKSSTYAYRQADYLVGVSQLITDYLSQFNLHTKTIYGAVKQSQYSEDFEKHYFDEKNNHKTLKVAHIANLQPVKNFPLTLSLAKALPSIQFYIVGSGALESELKQQAVGLDNVRFIPFTPYVGSVFKYVDLQVLPSHSEGLGGVILEGYQHLVPVIAHKVGGIPEIIEDGKTGYLIENNRLEDYIERLSNLEQDRTALNILQEGIQQFNKKHDFSIERMSQEYHAIYEEIFAKT